MSFELAIRLTEILIAFAFLQQGSEHLAHKKDRFLFMPRIVLSALLMAGFWTQWVCLALVIHALLVLKRFQGPYNGGSDRMGLLILCCLCSLHFMPTIEWQEYVFGYIAAQLTLSYFISGWVKLMNPEWRSGLALQDVFRFSVYPVSENVRALAQRPRLLCVMSWAVIVFELIFPLALLTHITLIIGLTIAALFHFVNAQLFGLNRFLWVWIAAYPSIIWLQQRIIEAL